MSEKPKTTGGGTPSGGAHKRPTPPPTSKRPSGPATNSPSIGGSKGPEKK